MRTEYMPLMDRIIDEAEELAKNQILHPYAYDTEIIDAVSEIVGFKMSINSTGAFLAIAAYRRIENAVMNVKDVVTV